MATVDDQATQVEERDRALALQQRRPEGPTAIGRCLFCELPLPVGMRWCDADCRDDWTRDQPAAR